MDTYAAIFIWMPISALIGALVIWIFYFVGVRLAKRRLWRLKNPKSLVVCASNAAIMDKGVYYRPATAIGELRALTLAVESLNKTYVRDLDIKNILLSSDQLHERFENDLLLLGGPKHNRVTISYLDLVDDKQPFKQTSNAIIWRCKKFLDLENAISLLLYAPT